MSAPGVVIATLKVTGAAGPLAGSSHSELGGGGSALVGGGKGVLRPLKRGDSMISQGSSVGSVASARVVHEEMCLYAAHTSGWP